MRTWADYLKTAQTEDPVFDAVRQNDYNQVMTYLKNLGNPDLKNHKGHSLLMLAAYNGHLSLVSLLISCRADVNSRDNSGNTILMGVAFKGHDKVARQLLRAGADLNARNPKGQTALSFAEAFGRDDLVRLFNELQSEPPAPGPRFWRRLQALSQFFIPARG
ncbi:ankyrin repeat domain-containing protein [Bdellovibrio bacteriovorus]|uniref:ankyrin repeat domain-containing protein n=1 Tax=Bdellovibrio bacteriovorus TaxID=959 RepID=UPI0035A5B3BB